MKITETHYLLNHVVLECGFERDELYGVLTQTEKVSLEIKNGQIVAMYRAASPLPEGIPQYDGEGKLLLPALQDSHIHLDKTYFGGPWRAPNRPDGTTVQDMIRLEQRLLPKLEPDTRQRAEKILQLIQSKGTTRIRTHCNIEPTSGLKNLQVVQAVLAEHQDHLAYEIVAFPQHGLLASNSEALMREAMQAGAHHVGGLDPALVDGAMEKSLDTLFQIALDYDKGVDIHLHETGAEGRATVNYMLNIVEQHPQLKGRVTLSHAFLLATLPEVELREMAQRLAQQQVTIASGIPLGKQAMPLRQLREWGVPVVVGTDSVIDHWSPFGQGDMLEKANLYAQLYLNASELTLSRALALVTGGILPLNDQGERMWPKVGDEASFMLVEATCSAEAVARISPRSATFYRGKQVAGEVAKREKSQV